MRLSWRNKLARSVWQIVWLLLCRPTPRVLHCWRRLLLRLFGARIGIDAHPYPSARIWAPWNLDMGEHSCLSEFVDCYNVDRIWIGAHATVSRYSFLCTASHDYASREAVDLLNLKYGFMPHDSVASLHSGQAGLKRWIKEEVMHGFREGFGRSRIFSTAM